MRRETDPTILALTEDLKLYIRAHEIGRELMRAVRLRSQFQKLGRLAMCASQKQLDSRISRLSAQIDAINVARRALPY